jgi:hypothetical protein
MEPTYLENLSSISNGAKTRAASIKAYEQGISRKLRGERSKHPELFPARPTVISNPTAHQELEECYECISNSLLDVYRVWYSAPDMKTHSMARALDLVSLAAGSSKLLK